MYDILFAPTDLVHEDTLRRGGHLFRHNHIHLSLLPVHLETHCVPFLAVAQTGEYSLALDRNKYR